MAKDKPRLCAALEVASAAIAKVRGGLGGVGLGVPSPLEGRGRCRPGGEGAGGSHNQPPASLQEEEGRDDSDALELYQQSLGELLLLLAGELGLWQGF